MIICIAIAIGFLAFTAKSLLDLIYLIIPILLLILSAYDKLTGGSV